MLNNKTFVLVIFLSLLSASQAFYQEKTDKVERRAPASAQEMKALLDERERRRTQEIPVEPTKGDKIISRSGTMKIDGDEIEMSFMVTMNEFRDTIVGNANETIGDKFVYSGPMTTASDATGTWTAGQTELGSATGSCVVCVSEPQWCCDFFFTFDKNGGEFFNFATVASSGYVFEDEGRFWVTGSGGDFVMSHNGMGEMVLDPFFNPVFYFKLNLRK